MIGRPDASWLGSFAPRAPERAPSPGPIPDAPGAARRHAECACGAPMPRFAKRCAQCSAAKPATVALCAICERRTADPKTLLCPRCDAKSHRRCGACGATLSTRNPGRRCAPCVERGQAERNDAAEARAAGRAFYREGALDPHQSPEAQREQRNRRRREKRAAEREAKQRTEYLAHRRELKAREREREAERRGEDARREDEARAADEARRLRAWQMLDADDRAILDATGTAGATWAALCAVAEARGVKAGRVQSLLRGGWLLPEGDRETRRYFAVVPVAAERRAA